MDLPCQETFGPSRLHWPWRIGTTAAADFCAHESGYPARPAFRASPTRGYVSQISPNKNVNFRCTSSPSTLESVGTFRCPRAAHLRISLGLYGVSVRSLAALADWVASPTHSQASSPRLVALPQLPSPRTLSIGVTFGILPSLRFPFSYRGLAPHKFTPMSGVPIRRPHVGQPAIRRRLTARGKTLAKCHLARSVRRMSLSRT